MPTQRQLNLFDAGGEDNPSPAGAHQVPAGGGYLSPEERKIMGVAAHPPLPPVYPGEITWSAFCHYMAEEGPYIPAAMRRKLIRAGIARRYQRQGTGRADEVLDFSDLVGKAEDALGPRPM
jgi:hypothetical protein